MKEKTMTTNSITSDQQKQFKRFVEDANDRVLKEVNPDKDGLQRLIEKGGEFQNDYIELVRRYTAKAPDYALARTILGGDFISPEGIAKARPGIVYTDAQLAKFGETLPSREILEWCRDNGYLVIAGPSKEMSLLEIRTLKSEYFYSKTEGWYANDNQKFSRDDKVEVRWLMLRKGPVADSTSKNWDEQKVLLSNAETVPNTAEVVWGMTTYKAVRGIYLLGNIHVRTSSLDSGGYRVCVGDFVSTGLGVNRYWDYSRYDSLGVSGARKQQ